VLIPLLCLVNRFCYELPRGIRTFRDLAERIAPSPLFQPLPDDAPVP